MRLHFLIAFIACAIVITGCKKAETTEAGTTGTTSQPAEAKSGDLVGSWVNDSPEAKDATTEFVFNNDGTYTMMASGPVPGKDITAKTDVSGTYKVDGDKLTLKMTSMTMGSSDATLQAEFDKQNAAMKDTLAKLPELPGKLAWADKDNLTLTMEPAAGSTDKPQDFKLKRKA